MNIKIPELSLVLLIGVSGSGKSSFAAKNFLATEVLSSDFCRGLVSDDQSSQAASQDAFDILRYIAGKRLAAGRLTVVDATNVQPEARRVLIELAKQHHVLCVAVVLNVAPEICLARNEARADRDFGPHVIRRQLDQLRRSQKGLRREGFHRVVALDGVEEIESATFTRERVWNDRRDDHGPFDIIGDVHGCFDELTALLGALGYEVAMDATTSSHPDGRKALFLGDLVDRGPMTPSVLRLVMGMVRDSTALCIHGNHEVKLLRALQGKQVTTSHGLAESLEQLKSEPEAFKKELVDFLDGLIGHYVLDDGQLVVAHAGLPASMHGRQSGAVRAFALYGDTTGETDEFGLPVRYPWTDEYRGDATVVYGHTPVPEATWINKTICLDTGCVFGGSLSALRYPERELVSVPAREVYYEPVRPLIPAGAGSDATRQPGELDLTDVVGKRIIETSLTRSVTIREENAIAALEVMSRWAIDPR
ncbi:MAG TPA: polynucleotide kinase-phosphatase [Acidimicrobiales bacterium]